MPGSPRLSASRHLPNEAPQANKSVFTVPQKPCQSQEVSNVPQASNSASEVRVLPVTPAPVPPSRPLQTHPNMQMRQNIRRSLTDTLLKRSERANRLDFSTDPDWEICRFLFFIGAFNGGEFCLMSWTVRLLREFYFFIIRVSDSDDLDIPESEVEKLAVNIEREMFNMYYTTDSKYKIKYRTLLLSLKDPKNKVCLMANMKTLHILQPFSPISCKLSKPKFTESWTWKNDLFSTCLKCTSSAKMFGL